MVVIDVIILKGRHVVSLEVFKTQALDQLHINHMGIEKNMLLACKSISCINIYDNIEKHINSFTTCLTFQQTQVKDKIIHHDIQAKPWEVIGADMFSLNNKHYFCIIDYRNKFPISKKTEDMSVYSLILMCKVIFAECRLPRQIMSDSGGNFIPGKFKMFCKSLNIEQAFCQYTTTRVMDK